MELCFLFGRNWESFVGFQSFDEMFPMKSNTFWQYDSWLIGASYFFLQIFSFLQKWKRIFADLLKKIKELILFEKKSKFPYVAIDASGLISN